MNIRKPSKKEAIALVLIITGVFGIIIGLPRAIIADTQFGTINIDETAIQVNEVRSMNLVASSTNQNSLVNNIQIIFDTTVIFEGDRIDVTAIAHGVKPNVDAIIVLFGNPNLDFTSMTVDSVKDEISHSLKFNTALELKRDSEPAWQKQSNIHFLKPDEKIVIQAVVVGDNVAHPIINKEIAFTVRPAIEKLTTEIILRQTEEAKIANFNQHLTNEILIGLGYAGIGIMLFVGGIDILVRTRRESKI